MSARQPYGAAKPIIVDGLNRGLTAPQIVKQYGFNRSTVYKTAYNLGLPINKVAAKKPHAR
jgi:hypothetical protein